MATAQLSSIVKLGPGSPTIRTGVISGTGTVNYTAPAGQPMRVSIVGSLTNTSTLTADGVSLSVATAQSVSFAYYIGPGQSTSISGTLANVIVSVNKVD